MGGGGPEQGGGRRDQMERAPTRTLKVSRLGTMASRMSTFSERAFQSAMVILRLLLPLMTIGHKASHYCHFRVLGSANSDTGRKKKKQKREKTKERKKKERRVVGFNGSGMTPST